MRGGLCVCVCLGRTCEKGEREYVCMYVCMCVCVWACLTPARETTKQKRSIEGRGGYSRRVFFLLVSSIQVWLGAFFFSFFSPPSSSSCFFSPLSFSFKFLVLYFFFILQLRREGRGEGEREEERKGKRGRERERGTEGQHGRSRHVCPKKKETEEKKRYVSVCCAQREQWCQGPVEASRAPHSKKSDHLSERNDACDILRECRNEYDTHTSHTGTHTYPHFPPSSFSYLFRSPTPSLLRTHFPLPPYKTKRGGGLLLLVVVFIVFFSSLIFSNAFFPSVFFLHLFCEYC